MSSLCPPARLSVSISVRLGARDVRVELQVEPGAPLALVGPNGAGKTSLLLALLGAQGEPRGRISLGPRTILDSDVGIDVPMEHRRFAYVPQKAALLPHLTAVENVEFALTCRGRHRPRDRRRVALALLERVALFDAAHRRPRALSAGQQQAVSVARALASAPRVLLLDEPTAALDASARGQVLALLNRYIHTLALPTILVTHDVRDIAALGHEVAVMHEGQIVARSPVDDLRRNPPTAFAAQLFSSQGTELQALTSCATCFAHPDRSRVPVVLPDGQPQRRHG